MRPAPAVGHAPGLGALHVLPSELSGLVFSFLEPAEVWRLRRVSKAFQSLLSDKLLELHAIRKYATHDPEDSALQGPITLDTLDSHFRSMKAHHAGIPVAVLQLPSMARYEPANEPRLCGSYLAYLAWDFMHVINLANGTTSMINTSGCYHHPWALTSKYIIVCPTTLTCSLYRIAQDGNIDVRPRSLLLEGRVIKMAAHASLLSVISAGCTADGHDELLIYNMETKQVVLRKRLEFDRPVWQYWSQLSIAISAESCLFVLAYDWDTEEAADSVDTELSVELACETGELQRIIAKVMRIELPLDGEASATATALLMSRDPGVLTAHSIEVLPCGKLDAWHIRFRSGAEHGSTRGRLERDMSWHLLPEMGDELAYWKGVTWTHDRPFYDGESYWKALTIGYDDQPSKTLCLLQKLIRKQVDACGWLLVNESFLIFGSWNFDITVYIFDSNASTCLNAPVPSMQVSRAFLDDPAVTHGWLKDRQTYQNQLKEQTNQHNAEYARRP